MAKDGRQVIKIRNACHRESLMGQMATAACPTCGHRVKAHTFPDAFCDVCAVIEVVHGGRDAESVARKFHEAYERLAPSFGYETRRTTSVPWEQVPADNKALMIAVVTEILF